MLFGHVVFFSTWLEVFCLVAFLDSRWRSGYPSLFFQLARVTYGMGFVIALHPVTILSSFPLEDRRCLGFGLQVRCQVLLHFTNADGLLRVLLGRSLFWGSG